jgi:hypothetical protein
MAPPPMSAPPMGAPPLASPQVPALSEEVIRTKCFNHRSEKNEDNKLNKPNNCWQLLQWLIRIQLNRQKFQKNL